MKKNLLKSIVFMMVAFVSQAVNAQSVNTTVSTSDFKACKAYLAEHPLDTIKNKLTEPVLMVVSEDGEIAGQPVQKGDTLSVLGYSVFLKDGKIVRQKNYGRTVIITVVDSSQVALMQKKAVATRLVYKVTDDSCRRDVRGYKIKYGDQTAIAVKKTADKNGVAVQAEGSYQLASDLYGFSGRAGGSYSRNWWMIDGVAGVSRTIYSDNAVHAGEKYLAFCSQVGFWLQPLRFDWYNQWRLWFGGGAGWEKYWSDSRETEAGLMRSEGNYIYPHAGLQLEYRFFATGNSLYAKAQWRQKKWIIQNADREVSNCFELSLGFRFGVDRNRVSH